MKHHGGYDIEECRSERPKKVQLREAGKKAAGCGKKLG